MRNVRVCLSLIVVLITMFSCRHRDTKAHLSETPQVDGKTVKKQSIVQKIKEDEQLNLKDRIALYRQLKKEKPNGYNFENEDEMTMYGYSYLWDDKVQEAIMIFKLIVAEFPASSNPYDSLGEAYMVNGDMDLALLNYRKSLALNPDNFNAEDQIERILHPERVPETPQEKFVKIYTAEQYRDDLDQLGKKLAEVHPNAFKFITETDFWNTLEQKKKLITDQTTYGEFIWHCSEIVANINCSHTAIGDFYSEWEMLPIRARFPLEVRWVEGELFVVDNAQNENKIDIKDQILSINGNSVSHLVEDVYKHIPSQGHIESSKRHKFNSWASGMIPYALNFPETYELVVKDKERPILLNTANKRQSNFKEPFKRPCPDNLCFELMEYGKSAVLTVSSFNYYQWNNLTDFTDFVDQSFLKLKEKGIENLIIDLRYNGGGSPESSIYLLKYLIDKPFTYFKNTAYLEESEIHIPFDDIFKGKLYFIVDGRGNSTTGHFMAIAKNLKLGTVIGEELGSNQFCTAGQTICRLSHTKLQFYVANSTSKVAVNGLSDAKGIIPDYHVTQNIDDYLNNRDTYKEFALRLTEKE